MARRRRRRKPSLLLELAIANAFAGQLFEREALRLGLDPPRGAGVLELVFIHGRATPTALEEVSGLPPTTLRERLQGLIDAGYVERIPNEADRRSYFLDVTEEGNTFLATITPAVRAAERAIRRSGGVPLDEYHRPLERFRKTAQALLAEPNVEPTLRSALPR